MALTRRKIDYEKEVVHRNVSFDMRSDKIPAYWFDNDPWLTHWMNALFINVPEGERFVMKSTREQLDKINDPSIHKAAISFIHQEASHAKAHDGMNTVLEEQGLPLEKAQFLGKLIFDSFQRFMPDDMKFAFAATGEHFTATLSTAMLENPELWDETPDEVAAMAFWHFVEEIEHKSVSFDIFQSSTGGGARAYALQMASLATALSTILIAVHLSWLYLVWKDRQLTNVRSAFKAAKRLLFSPGIATRAFISETLPALSPRFHPWDNDNRELINAWRHSYEQNEDPVQAYHAFRAWHANRKAGKAATRRTAA